MKQWSTSFRSLCLLEIENVYESEIVSTYSLKFVPSLGEMNCKENEMLTNNTYWRINFLYMLLGNLEIKAPNKWVIKETMIMPQEVRLQKKFVKRSIMEGDNFRWVNYSSLRARLFNLIWMWLGKLIQGWRVSRVLFLIILEIGSQGLLWKLNSHIALWWSFRGSKKVFGWLRIRGWIMWRWS